MGASFGLHKVVATCAFAWIRKMWKGHVLQDALNVRFVALHTLKSVGVVPDPTRPVKVRPSTMDLEAYVSPGNCFKKKVGMNSF